jgi:isopenicillin N synthase-like dioxygenase
VDPKYAGRTFEEAKKFFELPMKAKMEVFTELVPNQFVGYHPMGHYNRGGRKKRGKPEQRTIHLLINFSQLTIDRSL